MRFILYKGDFLGYIPQTDLAPEARELATANEGRLKDVTAKTRREAGALITELNIKNGAGAAAMGRPVGKYYTMELDKLPQEADESFEEIVAVIGGIIRSLLPESDIIAAGVGNLAVTPDALGPKVMTRVLVTRHITAKGGDWAGLFRSVTAIKPGVLGQTGVESAEVVAGVAKMINPAAVIAVDALAARRLDRLGRTVQITDTRIHPGAGIGNHRQALLRETLGVPVIGIGVPTVIVASTLISDEMAEMVSRPHGGQATDDNSAQPCGAKLPDTKTQGEYSDLFVTLRDIDTVIDRMSVLIGFSINHALQKKSLSKRYALLRLLDKKVDKTLKKW